MIQIDLKALFAKLTEPARQALEKAAQMCLDRTQFNVEIEHWLVCLIETNNSDIQSLFVSHAVNQDNLMRDLSQGLERYASGNPRGPALSPAIVELAKDAWLLASIQFGHNSITSGHILTSIVMNTQLHQLSAELGNLPPHALLASNRVIVGQTDESKYVTNLNTAAG